jgi:ubiquinol oxidase
LEEEAIVSYNAFAKEIREGHIENTPAPKVAIDYYNLDKSARLVDVVYAVRADEAAHRDANIILLTVLTRTRRTYRRKTGNVESDQ